MSPVCRVPRGCPKQRPWGGPSISLPFTFRCSWSPSSSFPIAYALEPHVNTVCSKSPRVTCGCHSRTRNTCTCQVEAPVLLCELLAACVSGSSSQETFQRRGRGARKPGELIAVDLAWPGSFPQGPAAALFPLSSSFPRFVARPRTQLSTLSF